MSQSPSLNMIDEDDAVFSGPVTQQELIVTWLIRRRQRQEREKREQAKQMQRNSNKPIQEQSSDKAPISSSSSKEDDNSRVRTEILNPIAEETAESVQEELDCSSSSWVLEASESFTGDEDDLESSKNTMVRDSNTTIGASLESTNCSFVSVANDSSSCGKTERTNSEIATGSESASGIAEYGMEEMGSPLKPTAESACTPVGQPCVDTGGIENVCAAPEVDLSLRPDFNGPAFGSSDENTCSPSEKTDARISIPSDPEGKPENDEENLKIVSPSVAEVTTPRTTSQHEFEDELSDENTVGSKLELSNAAALTSFNGNCLDDVSEIESSVCAVDGDKVTFIEPALIPAANLSGQLKVELESSADNACPAPNYNSSPRPDFNGAAFESSDTNSCCSIPEKDHARTSMLSDPVEIPGTNVGIVSPFVAEVPTPSNNLQHQFERETSDDNTDGAKLESSNGEAPTFLNGESNEEKPDVDENMDPETVKAKQPIFGSLEAPGFLTLSKLGHTGSKSTGPRQPSKIPKLNILKPTRLNMREAADPSLPAPGSKVPEPSKSNILKPSKSNILKASNSNILKPTNSNILKPAKFTVDASSLSKETDWPRRLNMKAIPKPKPPPYVRPADKK